MIGLKLFHAKLIMVQVLGSNNLLCILSILCIFIVYFIVYNLLCIFIVT